MNKKFSDHYSEYKDHSVYSRMLQHWIMDYESIEDDDKRIAQYFGDLLIDIQNDNTFEPDSFYFESEQFSISSGQLKGSKSITVVNTLVDNTFKYQITLNDKTVLPTIVSAPYVFNLSLDSQFNDIEFKRLFIDS